MFDKLKNKEAKLSIDLLESLHKKHKEDIDILEKQLVSSHAGISRRNSPQTGQIILIYNLSSIGVRYCLI